MEEKKSRKSEQEERVERLPVGSEVGLKERVPLHGSCSDYLVRSFDHVKWHPMEHEHAEVGRSSDRAREIAKCFGRAQVVGRHVRYNGTRMHIWSKSGQRLARLGGTEAWCAGRTRVHTLDSAASCPNRGSYTRDVCTVTLKGRQLRNGCCLCRCC